MFVGPDKARYAVTKDVTVTEFTYLQFYISMSCYDSGRCYGELPRQPNQFIVLITIISTNALTLNNELSFTLSLLYSTHLMKLNLYFIIPDIKPHPHLTLIFPHLT